MTKGIKDRTFFSLGRDPLRGVTALETSLPKHHFYDRPTVCVWGGCILAPAQLSLLGANIPHIIDGQAEAQRLCNDSLQKGFSLNVFTSWTLHSQGHPPRHLISHPRSLGTPHMMIIPGAGP